MNKKKLSAFILIILTIIVFYYLIKDNYKEIFASIANANYWWLLLGLILYSIYLLVQSIPFYEFTKMHKHNVSLKFYIYLSVVTNFFNGITPMATGGQPLQIYEMHKKGISVVNATNIVLENFIVFQFTAVFLGMIALVANCIFHLFEVNPLLENMTIIGFVLNTLLLLFVIVASFSKTFIQKIITFILKLLNKIKIVKDIDKQKEKWNKTCLEFYENFQILLKHKKLLFKNILMYIISFLAYFSVPICIINALGIDTNVNLIMTIIMSSYIFLASSYLPIPGATGGMEYAFLGYFGNFITGFKLNSLLLIWRFITYYLPLIVGGITFNIHSIKNNTKTK